MFAFSSLYHEQKTPKNGNFPSLCIPAGITLDHHSFTLTLLIDPRVLSAAAVTLTVKEERKEKKQQVNVPCFCLKYKP